MKNLHRFIDLELDQHENSNNKTKIKKVRKEEQKSKPLKNSFRKNNY